MTLLRNTDGFATTLEPGERHGYFKRPLPFDYFFVYEDFIAAASAIPPGWTHTNTNGTLALASGTNITQTLGGADNDASHLYPTTATITIAAGKRAHFRWRGKIDKGSGGTSGQEEFYIGVGAAQTTTNFVNAGGTALAVDDFIGFAKFDTTNNINCICRKTDVESAESSATTYTDATVLELGFDYDGTTVTFYKDSIQVAEIATNVPTAALTLHMKVKAGGAHAKVMTTDYIWFAVER